MQIKFFNGFVFPGDVFDNVKGQFPIAFQIWHYDGITPFEDKFEFDVFDGKNNYIGKKTFLKFSKGDFIVDWLKSYTDKRERVLGIIYHARNDFQNSNYIQILSSPQEPTNSKSGQSNMSGKTSSTRVKST
jgi:hypothetical protein